MSGKYFQIIKSMYDKATSRVKFNAQLSEIFENLNGVLQGGVISPTLFKFFLDDISRYFDKEKGIRINEHSMTYLLFADDLILLSETDTGLQSLIGGLETFCKHWHMQVNFKKTKISIFNEKYRPSKEIENFVLSDHKIDQTTSYNFLGTVFSTSRDRFKSNHQDKRDKAMRAIYAAKKLMRETIGNHASPTVLFKIYDSQIQPIIDYGTEIWYAGKPINMLEIIHNKFIKYTLGVKRQTSTLAIYGECGRFPLYVRQNELMLKYWCRILSLEPTNPLHYVYQELRSLNNSNHRTWCTGVFNILKSIGYDHIWDRHMQTMTNNEISDFSGSLKNILRDQYKDYWHREINNSINHSILRTYITFKSEHNWTPYLSAHISNIHRKCIAKFRVSSHQLRVETGRHQRPPVPLEDRLCLYCDDGNIDDELHLLTTCKFHDAERLQLYACLDRNIDNFINLTRDTILKEALQSDNPDVISALGHFLNTSYRRRKFT